MDCIICQPKAFGGDDRLAGVYKVKAAEGTFSSTGFPLDFCFIVDLRYFAGYYLWLKEIKASALF